MRCGMDCVGLLLPGGRPVGRSPIEAAAAIHVIIGEHNRRSGERRGKGRNKTINDRKRRQTMVATRLAAIARVLSQSDGM